VLALLAVPSTALAQRDAFFSAVVAFYRSLAGLYGDEGAQLTTQLAAMSTALDRWDGEIGDAERELRSRLQSADDVPTHLQAHTLLASLYVERGRWSDAAREFEEDIRIDPRRGAFHRLKGLVLRAMPRPAEAAEAFRTAWLLDPADSLDAYRLISQRSVQTTPAEIEHALGTLADVERALIRRERPGAPAPFPNLGGIVDDATGAIAFVPAAYASGFTFILQGELDRGVAAFRAALATDPLITSGDSRSEAMARGISALRQAASAKASAFAGASADKSAPEGLVSAAIEHLEAAVAGAGDSSEARRILASAYSTTGDVAASVRHLRDAIRLNARDERSWLALARALDEAGRSEEAADVLRAAVAEVPDAGVLRWRLSTTVERLQQADDADLNLLAMADRFVLLVGKGELYRALARLAELHLDYERAIGLLQQSVSTTPNNVAAHRALGHAFIENGRDDEGYAELVIALLLDPDAVETLTELGRLHLAADRPARAVEALERAVGVDPANPPAVRALADALIRVRRTVEGKQRMEEAERLLTRAIEGDRRAKAAAALRLNAEVRRGERDYAAAIDLWRQAISLQPGSAAVHLRLADALVAANRPDEAVAEYRTAIALDAGADARRRLAELYDALGRPDEASRERTIHVERRLEELRQRAEQGAYGS
jgi:tetratricopeptide (TPR) repeat protein